MVSFPVMQADLLSQLLKVALLAACLIDSNLRKGLFSLTGPNDGVPSISVRLCLSM